MNTECLNKNQCEWWWCKNNQSCFLYFQETRKKIAKIKRIENAPQSQSVLRRVSNPFKKGSSKALKRHKRRLEIYKRDGYRCVACGSPDNLTLDHNVPVSKGGKDNEENLKTMCLTCNQKKADLMPEEFYAEKEPVEIPDDSLFSNEFKVLVKERGLSNLTNNQHKIIQWCIDNEEMLSLYNNQRVINECIEYFKYGSIKTGVIKSDLDAA